MYLAISPDIKTCITIIQNITKLKIQNPPHQINDLIANATQSSKLAEKNHATQVMYTPYR
jgi:hypothetical protein